MSEGNGKLPAGWRTAKLGDLIVEAATGFACGRRANDGAIQLRMNNVTRRGELDWSSFIRVPVEKAMLDDYALRTGDVMFNNTNSTEMVGKTALFNDFDEPVVFSNHFTRLRTKPDALAPDFLALWLHAQWQAGLFARICDRWIGQSAVQRNKLLTLEISLPPLDEQRRIARQLREQLSILAEARAALEAQLAAAESLPAAHLRAVFQTAEAEQWLRTALGELCDIVANQVNPTDAEFADLPHVSAENIETGTLQLTRVRSAREDRMTSGKYLFEQGDVLYSKLRPYLRKVAIAPSRGLCSADMYPLRMRPDRMDARYVAWLLLSDQFTKYAIGQSQRSRMPKLNRDQLFAWKAPVPSLEKQRGIAAHFDAAFSETRAVREGFEAKLAELEKLPAAFLRVAFQLQN